MLPNRQNWILNHRHFRTRYTHSPSLGANLLKIFLSLAIALPLVPGSAIAQSSGIDSSDAPTPAKSPGSCAASASDPTALSQLADRILQAASWTDNPSQVLQSLSLNLGPQLAAYFSPSPWPDINEKAKLAKVPIVMYHDILPKKQVFFDVTPQELEQHFQFIQKQGLTPISFDQLAMHLRTGLPLPEKPIMLTFDDGYGGHYEYVYPLLKKYGYPAVFSIYTSGVGVNSGRTHVNWEQLQEMAADPLITIAAHSVTHPEDLRKLPDDKLEREIVESKQILETQLGIPIRYFTYPAGKYDERVAQVVKQAGYQAALTMDDRDERFAGDSASLLAVGRFGQSNLARAIRRFDGSAIAQASGGAKLPTWGKAVDFSAAVAMNKTTIDRTTLMLISGGRPTTIHADSRYQVQEILADTPAIAGVDGGFFSLKLLDSNVMIGPVLSQGENGFVPGNSSDNSKLSGRPLVLISPYTVKFVPFDPVKHNTLEGIQAEMSDVTDAFVASAWLVKDGIGRSRQTFGTLYGFDALRHRAFWGINQARQPTIGVTKQPIDAVGLGAVLAKAGLNEAVMLDSGASTSLIYKGESLVGYTPRPVPHVVALLPPQSNNEANCITAQR